MQKQYGTKKTKLRIAAVQLNAHQTDKQVNLVKMEKCIAEASENRTDIICFPEICITGYTFLSDISDKKDLLAIAERIPDGPSIRRIRSAAARYSITVLFGLLEKTVDDRLYNTFVCVTPEGVLHTYRKIHAFENDHILSGESFETFELHGWKCGILICFDNNLPENPRLYALQGCEILFAPHQTGGFAMNVDGMGVISPSLWNKRETHRKQLSTEFAGPKGRQWLMKWLPSRAYDNNMFYVFSNGVGTDGNEVRTGNAMLLSPNGSILAESTSIETDMVYADFEKSQRKSTLGEMHMQTRRPELYAPLRAAGCGGTATIRAREKLMKATARGGHVSGT